MSTVLQFVTGFSSWKLIVYHSKNKLLSKQALNESGEQNLEANTFRQILRELLCRYKD